MIAFKHVNSARSIFNRFILTLSSERIRSNIGATPAWCALFRCNVKFGPKHINCGGRTGARRSIVPSAFVRSASKYWSHSRLEKINWFNIKFHKNAQIPSIQKMSQNFKPTSILRHATVAMSNSFQPARNNVTWSSRCNWAKWGIRRAYSINWYNCLLTIWQRCDTAPWRWISRWIKWFQWQPVWQQGNSPCILAVPPN